jgi:hypothetical protein
MRRHLRIPNVVMVPIAEKRATWDLFIAWQRGRMSNPLRALLDSFQGVFKGNEPGSAE